MEQRNETSVVNSCKEQERKTETDIQIYTLKTLSWARNINISNIVYLKYHMSGLETSEKRKRMRQENKKKKGETDENGDKEEKKRRIMRMGRRRTGIRI